ncbi:MAG: tellurite resistance TerB family protein [Hyphomicrobiaceae bacterium]
MPAVLSPEQALIYSMITIAAADRSLSDSELRRIGTMVRELPPFRDFDEQRLVGEAQMCGEIMSGDGGLEAILGLIAEALPPHLRETAYMLACEVAVADHRIEPEESRFLDLLGRRLGLDPLIRRALERGAQARHQRLRTRD